MGVEFLFVVLNLLIPLVLILFVVSLFLRLIRATETIAETLRRIEEKLDRRQ